MTDAGAKENAPLLVGNGAFVADRQRCDHAGVRPALERGEDARANGLAQSLHIIARPARERIEASVALVVANVAGGTQLVLQEPRFDVEAVRVHRPMRALELHGKRPAFTRVKLRNLGAGLVFAPRSIPAEREPRRHDRAEGDDSLDRERQTRASRSNLRQLVDDADDIDVAAFPGGGQLVGEPDLGAPCAVVEAPKPDGDGGRKDRQVTRRAADRRIRVTRRDRRKQRQHQGKRAPRCMRRGRQVGLLLQRQHSEREREQQPAHWITSHAAIDGAPGGASPDEKHAARGACAAPRATTRTGRVGVAKRG